MLLKISDNNTMKLLHAKSIISTIEQKRIETLRRDMIHSITFQLPPGVGDGPLDEIISLTLYDGTDTLEIDDAATDMNDLDTIVYNGREYRITEKQESRQYGFGDSIKCTRQLVNGI